MPNLLQLSSGIPEYFIGKITSFWVADHGYTPEPEDLYSFAEEIHVQMDIARKDGILEELLLMASTLIHSQTIDICKFNGSEADWTEDEIRRILEVILSTLSQKEADILGELALQVEWLEMDMKTWRTSGLQKELNERIRKMLRPVQEKFKVGIPHNILAIYLGDITFEIEQAFELGTLEIGDVPEKFLEEAFMHAFWSGDLTALYLGLVHLAANEEARLERYSSAEMDFEESEIRNILLKLLDYLKQRQPKLLRSNDLFSVTLVEQNMAEWRVHTRPAFLDFISTQLGRSSWYPYNISAEGPIPIPFGIAQSYLEGYFFQWYKHTKTGMPIDPMTDFQILDHTMGYILKEGETAIVELMLAALLEVPAENLGQFSSRYYKWEAEKVVSKMLEAYFHWFPQPSLELQALAKRVVWYEDAVFWWRREIKPELVKTFSLLET